MNDSKLDIQRKEFDAAALSFFIIDFGLSSQSAVRARVLVLDAYRRPWQQGSLDVFLYTPMGDEIHRWIARHATMGVVHVEYDLADAETIEGEWTIRAATR